MIKFALSFTKNQISCSIGKQLVCFWYFSLVASFCYISQCLLICIYINLIAWWYTCFGCRFANFHINHSKFSCYWIFYRLRVSSNLAAENFISETWLKWNKMPNLIQITHVIIIEKIKAPLMILRFICIKGQLPFCNKISTQNKRWFDKTDY